MSDIQVSDFFQSFLFEYLNFPEVSLTDMKSVLVIFLELADTLKNNFISGILKETWKKTKKYQNINMTYQ